MARVPQAGTLLISPRTIRPSPEPYIKGPLPLWWIVRAGRTKGAGLHVAMELFYRAGIEKSDEVKISLAGIGRRFGIHRTAAARGLRDLETAGLVTVQRPPGRKVIVRVISRGSSTHRGASKSDATASESNGGPTSTILPGEATMTGAPAPRQRPGAWSEPTEGPNMETSTTKRDRARRGWHAPR
jgi:hypothetical protein